MSWCLRRTSMTIVSVSHCVAHSNSVQGAIELINAKAAEAIATLGSDNALTEEVFGRSYLRRREPASEVDDTAVVIFSGPEQSSECMCPCTSTNITLS